jgi:hypothetical protein
MQRLELASDNEDNIRRAELSRSCLNRHWQIRRLRPQHESAGKCMCSAIQLETPENHDRTDEEVYHPLKPGPALEDSGLAGISIPEKYSVI